MGIWFLNEPVAWKSLIVMNTREDFENAFQEYRENRFIQSVQ
ncbi:MAG TPA: pirin-like C-terminal cupin domain-containing protein [Desulfotignum sp.]|nr:pirin-like C-terminal cupin domain-containing protein [Desulfotignum sp.]